MTLERIEKLLKLCDEWDGEHVASYYLRECLQILLLEKQYEYWVNDFYGKNYEE